MPEDNIGDFRLSYSAREKLRNGKARLVKKYNFDIEELNWLTENYIEEICRESDLQCKKIDPAKAVDQVIDEMDEEMFDKFIKGCIEDVKIRIDKSKNLIKKRKKKASDVSDDQQIPYVYPDNSTPFIKPTYQESRREEQVAIG